MNLGFRAASRKSSIRLVCGSLLICEYFALVAVQRGIDRQLSASSPLAEVLYIPSGDFLRRLSLGHEGLLADIYWTRVVQYYGRKRLGQETRFELLGPLLRITTALDPHLVIAYRFGAVFLAAKPPGGAGQPQEALYLLRRGIVANPDYWRLWQDLGFIYYWDLKDYANAARVFRAGSERPGAQLWMKVLAVTVAEKGGDFQTSFLLWSEIYRQAENDQIRKSAQDHLAALVAEDELKKLNDLLARYREREGHEARSFHELVIAGFLETAPKDPYGTPYIVGPDGRVRLAPHSKIDLQLLR